MKKYRLVLVTLAIVSLMLPACGNQPTGGENLSIQERFDRSMGIDTSERTDGGWWRGTFVPWWNDKFVPFWNNDDESEPTATPTATVLPDGTDDNDKDVDEGELAHDQRLLSLAPEDYPNSFDRDGWLRDAGFSWSRLEQQARQIEEETIDDKIVPAGVQVAVTNLSVDWPAVMTTDREVPAGAVCYQPDPNNGSRICTNLEDFSGTATLWVDGSNWGQLVAMVDKPATEVTPTPTATPKPEGNAQVSPPQGYSKVVVRMAPPDEQGRKAMHVRELTRDDYVTVTTRVQGSDGYIWAQIGEDEWVREDLLKYTGSKPRLTVSKIATTTPKVGNTPTPTTEPGKGSGSSCKTIAQICEGEGTQCFQDLFYPKSNLAGKVVKYVSMYQLQPGEEVQYGGDTYAYPHTVPAGQDISLWISEACRPLARD
jgi:hypothetical protein